VRLSGDEVDVAELMALARQVVARRAMGKLLGDESVNSLDRCRSVSHVALAYNGEAIPADELTSLSVPRRRPFGLWATTAWRKSPGPALLARPDERKGLSWAVL